MDMDQARLLRDDGRFAGGLQQAADAVGGMRHAGAFAPADARGVAGGPQQQQGAPAGAGSGDGRGRQTEVVGLSGGGTRIATGQLFQAADPHQAVLAHGVCHRGRGGQRDARPGIGVLGGQAAGHHQAQHLPLGIQQVEAAGGGPGAAHGRDQCLIQGLFRRPCGGWFTVAGHRPVPVGRRRGPCG
ncbi:hypothetical protein GCM10010206_65510 [Streptomyces cinerochromogenes]|nr:hypothetical protein GCM10010206_65510 [Streptomyces cinerochromogenes]